MEKKEVNSQLVQFLFFVLAVILFFRIVEPLITIFLTSVLLTYLAYPMYIFIRRGIRNQFTSIILTIGLALLILLLPFSYLSYMIGQESYQFYQLVSSNLEEGKLVQFSCVNDDGALCRTMNRIDRLTAQKFSRIGMEDYLRKVLDFLIGVTGGYLVKIPQAILGTGMTLFISYFLFRDGEKILERVVNWIPFRQNTSERLVSQFNKVTYAIVFSQLFVAIAQGLLGAVGFYFFGVPLPLFWGVVMAFLALIPLIGTALVWVPASAFLILNGYFSNDSGMMVKGIGLLVYGVLIVSTIDNILRVKIIHARAEVHPLIVIAGVIGGVNLFGIIGLFLGPIIISMLMSYFDSVKEGFV